MEIDERTRIKCNVIHRNRCGDPIKDDKGSVVICCGEDLDSCGDSDAFAQCTSCRFEDFVDHIINLNRMLLVK